MMQIFADKAEGSLSGVSYLRKAARMRLREFRLPKLIIDDIQLAIAEIGANVINHAHTKPSHIGLKLAIIGHEIHLAFSDNGSSFKRFDEAYRKKLPNFQKEYETSGRGVDLVKQLLKDIDYKQGEENLFTGKLSLSPNRPHLLFVEDEQTLLDFYALSFSGNYQVSLASNIEDALVIVRNQKIDIIIADLHLQGENILDLLKIMENDTELAVIPTIIGTGENDPTLHREALMLGAETVLVKPISIGILRKTVELTLAKSAKQRVGLFRYFATSVNKLMEKKIPSSFDHYSLKMAEGQSGIGGGDIIAHYSFDDYNRIIFADIMGHGLSASASAISFATLTRCLQSLTSSKDSPSNFLNSLTKVMHHDEALASIMATICVIDFTKSGIVRYAMAGHPPPLLIKGAMTQILESGGPILGLFDSDIYKTYEFSLKQGERLFLYTDGIDPFGLTASGKLPDWVINNIVQHKDFSLEQSTFALKREIIHNVSGLPVDDWTILMIEAGKSL